MPNNQRGLVQVILIVITLIGLVVGIFLVQRQQQLKSRASTNMIQAFEIKDGNGAVVNCEANKTPPECNIST